MIQQILCCSKINPIEKIQFLKELRISDFEETTNSATPINGESKLIQGNNVKIQPFVTYEGIIILGNNVCIGPYTFLRGPLFLDDNVQIGPHCEITRSVILKNTKICHKNIIPDSVINSNVWIAGGVIICNTRIDLKSISFEHDGVKIQLEKFGAYVEENVKIGVNTIIMPGTHIAKNKIIVGPTTVKGKV